jgi:putative tryptophan/tyrosine transport system substrate-binding protein
LPVIKRRAFTKIVVCGLIAVPLNAVAQAVSARFRVGYLSSSIPQSATELLADSFTQGLRDLGYVEGKNVTFERRWASGRLDRLPELAAELARLPVDVIVVQGPSPVRAAAQATKTIPIVMIAGSNDPVGEGLVESLARPGRNLTGVTYAVSPERFGKQLELLKLAAPGISRVAVWWDGDLGLFRQSIATPLKAQAHKLGVEAQDPVPALEPGAYGNAFATFKQQRADALMLFFAGPSYVYRERLASLAIENRLPTVSAFKEVTAAGGLLSYGPDFGALARRAAAYVDKILRGAKASELPIELPTKYEFAINLKTAQALGLNIPQSLLIRADEIIQ